MNFHRLLLPRKLLPSTSVSTPSASIAWRNQIKQTQLISQVSTALLQRRDWSQIIKNLNLSAANLTPSFFLNVLHRTQSHPQISLAFYNWVKSRLGFQPDIRTLCKLSQILIGSGQTHSSKPILESLIQTYPPTDIVDSSVQACSRGKYVLPIVLDSIIQSYCVKGLYLQALESIRRAHKYGQFVSLVTCNSVLHLLERVNEIRLGWCLFCLLIRNGDLLDQSTWSIIVRMLSKDGKFDRICRILDLGLVESDDMFNILIDYYSGIGDFGAAFNYLNKMIAKKLNPDFRTYSSILNGACKYEDFVVIETVMHTMNLATDYDSIICKLSDFEKTHAMQMFFERANEEKIVLQVSSYGSMLCAFSKEGRVKEAISIYNKTIEKELKVGNDCFYPFVNALCRLDAPDEAGEILIDLIRKGFHPSEPCLSKFIFFLCSKRRFNRAEELLDVILVEGLVPDSLCCSSIVKHYCDTGRINSAVCLHEKMEKLGGNFNVDTYDNVLLKELVKEKRIGEAVRIFNYMKSKDLVSSVSFSIMISGLCEVNELKKAMELHDEMMKMGLKPDNKTYKDLIYGFK
ncbi:pentatricopeptide repeat-containing protein At4g21170 [Impatiens glandulifera]|uniref:pentatricopeptide repeat-containing protein At4g21170 n=1 Tax=Impatiens glandulifera TaxID=253017 RepID=UPI001FB14359|nr:pentatricopeptide repeat-containing protein At4g21170 [Impatiens glandulifera]